MPAILYFASEDGRVWSRSTSGGLYLDPVLRNRRTSCRKLQNLDSNDVVLVIVIEPNTGAHLLRLMNLGISNTDVQGIRLVIYIDSHNCPQEPNESARAEEPKRMTRAPG